MTTSTLLPPSGVTWWRQGSVVACTGACGGAGSSVLAAALARAVVESGRSCLLVDGDALGSGLDLLLGAEDAPGMRWPDLRLARGRLPSGLLAGALPAVDGITLLSGDRRPAGAPTAEALHAVIASGRAEFEVVVLDRGRGPVAGDPASALELVDLGVVVVPAQVRAAAAVGSTAAGVFPGVRELRLVVRGPAPAGLTAAVVSSASGLPLTARMRPEPGLDAALERGEPPGLRPRGPLRRAAAAVLAELAAVVASRSEVPPPDGHRPPPPDPVVGGPGSAAVHAPGAGPVDGVRTPDSVAHRGGRDHALAGPFHPGSGW